MNRMFSSALFIIAKKLYITSVLLEREQLYMIHLYAGLLCSHCNNGFKGYLMKWGNAHGNISYEEH